MAEGAHQRRNRLHRSAAGAGAARARTRGPRVLARRESLRAYRRARRRFGHALNSDDGHQRRCRRTARSCISSARLTQAHRKPPSSRTVDLPRRWHRSPRPGRAVSPQLVYLSVAHPAPVMEAYIAIARRRRKGDRRRRPHRDRPAALVRARPGPSLADRAPADLRLSSVCSPPPARARSVSGS